MRIRRRLADTTTNASTSSAIASSDPFRHNINILQTLRRCSNNSNTKTTTRSRIIIICVLNQSPWDVTDLSSLQLLGGLFSLTGTTPVVPELAIGSQSFGSSVKLCGEETTLAASDKCLNRSENANSDGLSQPEVQIRAEKSSTVREVVSSSKLQIRTSSVKKQQHNSSDSAQKSEVKRRGMALKKSVANTNEFYYYSGFGPHWGKKRETVVASDQELKVKNAGGTERDIEFLDYDDDDDECEINIGENEEGTRRPGGRKRVKARSLKSLM